MKPLLKKLILHGALQRASQVIYTTRPPTHQPTSLLQDSTTASCLFPYSVQVPPSPYDEPHFPTHVSFLAFITPLCLVTAHTTTATPATLKPNKAATKPPAASLSRHTRLNPGGQPTPVSMAGMPRSVHVGAEGRGASVVAACEGLDAVAGGRRVSVVEEDLGEDGGEEGEEQGKKCEEGEEVGHQGGAGTGL